MAETTTITTPQPTATEVAAATTAQANAVAQAAYNATDDDVPGYKTSEFWVTIATILFIIIEKSGLIGNFNLDTPTVISLVVLVVGYVSARFGLKTGSNNLQVALTDALSKLPPTVAAPRTVVVSQTAPAATPTTTTTTTTAPGV